MTADDATTPNPVRPRPLVPESPGGDGGIPTAEREFFVEEFRGITIVVSLPSAGERALRAIDRTLAGFEPGDTRFLLVVPDDDAAERLRDALHVPARIVRSTSVWEDESMAGLWIAVADEHVVIAVAGEDDVIETAGFLAAGLRASKMVLTDDDGGWGSPVRSFAELTIVRDALAADLTVRGIGHVVPAAEEALRGGAFSVNLCRAEDLERELFTFDGRGTLLTLGGYVHLTNLRVDDLPAVEALIARGVADGVLRPRSREQIATMAVGGLGARVIRTGHLAGVVGLDTERYGSQGVAEVAGLITVSEFSGAGAGGLLIEGLKAKARDMGLNAMFAVTVSSSASRFFRRCGFSEVAQDVLPAVKWQGYDPQRRRAARAFWLDVGG